MKGALVRFFVVVLAAGLLAACRQATPGPVAIATPPPATTDSAAVSAAPTEPVIEGHIAVLLTAGLFDELAGYFQSSFTAAGAQFAILPAADADTQAAQAAAELAEGAKVIVLAPVDEDAGAVVVAAARDAGIEVIGFGRLTTTAPDLHVGYDDRLAGRLLAEGLAPLIDGLATDSPRVVVLNGPADDASAALMRDGLDETLAPRLEAGQWQMAGDFAAGDWDAAQAETQLTALLDSGGTVDAVFATDDRLANAAASVLAARGLDTVPLSGRGATLDAVRRLLNGQQALTLYTPARLEAVAAAAAAVDLLRGDEIPSLTNDTISNGQADVPYIRLRPLAVSAADIESILIADGQLTWEEICAAGVLGSCPPE